VTTPREEVTTVERMTHVDPVDGELVDEPIYTWQELQELAAEAAVDR
jgi:hypothetical protein